MPQLDPTWFASQLFWLAIIFVALHFVLSRLVLPPLQDTIARRKQTVEGDLERAQRLKTHAEKARQDYERTLTEARHNAQALIAEGMQAQKADAERANKDLDKQIEQKLSSATAQITARKQELMDALAPTASELASMIVEKLTARAPGKDQLGKAIGNLTK